MNDAIRLVKGFSVTLEQPVSSDQNNELITRALREFAAVKVEVDYGIYRQCPSCPRLFEINNKRGSRLSRGYCSVACRCKAHRQKKAGTA